MGGFACPTRMDVCLMPHVHPTAIIDSSVTLADDVEVGPHCVLEGNVTIAAGSKLIGRVWIQGNVTIGAANLIFPNACVGFPPQHRSTGDSGAGVVIGDRNVLREGVTITGPTVDEPSTLGDDNLLMANSHIGHDAHIGNHCTLANGSLIAGHVDIGDHVILGGNAAVHQFSRIGRYGFLAGVTGLTKDLPPFCMVYTTSRVGSLNMVGLRRAGFAAHLPNLQKAFAIVFRQQHANARAAAMIREQFADDALCMELADFVATTQRGITAYRDRHSDRVLDRAISALQADDLMNFEDIEPNNDA